MSKVGSKAEVLDEDDAGGAKILPSPEPGKPGRHHCQIIYCLLLARTQRPGTQRFDFFFLSLPSSFFALDSGQSASLGNTRKDEDTFARDGAAAVKGGGGAASAAALLDPLPSEEPANSTQEQGEESNRARATPDFTYSLSVFYYTGREIRNAGFNKLSWSGVREDEGLQVQDAVAAKKSSSSSSNGSSSPSVVQSVPATIPVPSVHQIPPAQQQPETKASPVQQIPLIPEAKQTGAHSLI